MCGAYACNISHENIKEFTGLFHRWEYGAPGSKETSPKPQKWRKLLIFPLHIYHVLFMHLNRHWPQAKLQNWWRLCLIWLGFLFFFFIFRLLTFWKLSWPLSSITHFLLPPPYSCSPSQIPFLCLPTLDVLVPQSFAWTLLVPHSIQCSWRISFTSVASATSYILITPSLICLVQTSLCAVPALITCSYCKLSLSPKWAHCVPLVRFSPSFPSYSVVPPSIQFQARRVRDIFEPFLFNLSHYIDLHYLEILFKNKNLSAHFSFSSHCHCPCLVLSVSL